MKIIRNELQVAFDVDFTLIDYVDENILSHEDLIEVNYYGIKKKVLPIKEHIELLISHKKRGYHIVVWSGNGSSWAIEIIKKLKLEQYVDEVRTKFVKYVDDQSFDDFAKRIYIRSNNGTK